MIWWNREDKSYKNRLYRIKLHRPCKRAKYGPSKGTCDIFKASFFDNI